MFFILDLHECIVSVYWRKLITNSHLVVLGNLFLDIVLNLLHLFVLNLIDLGNRRFMVIRYILVATRSVRDDFFILLVFSVGDCLSTFFECCWNRLVLITTQMLKTLVLRRPKVISIILLHVRGD